MLFKSQLQIHMESMHEGKKHQCSYCDYKASYQHTVKSHILTVHKGIRYPCDKCGYVAESLYVLDAHTWEVHDDSFECNFCDENL